MRNLGASVLFTAIYTLAFPLSADAARLGKLTVRSAIGEPFNAEIGLAATPEELSTLTVRLAPSTEYMEQGIDYPASLSSVHIDLVKRTDNTAYILINSPLPHGSPFLELLVQAEWATGMIMRPYTTIENTPVFSQQKPPSDTANTNIAATAASPSSQPLAKEASPPAQETPQQATKPATTSNEPVTQNEPLVSATQVSTSHQNEDLQSTPSTQRNPDPEPLDNSKLVTKPGDTLFNIALKSNPGGLTTEQVLRGIFAANKHAFIKNDMNRLKAGQKIRIPGKDELLAMAEADDQSKLKIKTDDWGKFSMQLAEQAKESENSEEDGQKKRDAKGALSVDVATDHHEFVGDHHIVKLTSDLSRKAGNGSADKATQIAAIKDDTIARQYQEKQLEEAKRLLEKQIQDAQKLLDMKNSLVSQKSSQNSQTAAIQDAQASSNPGNSDNQKSKDSAIFAAGSILTLLGFIWLLFRSRRNKLPIQ